MTAQRTGSIRRWSIAGALVLVAGIIASREAKLREPTHRPAADVPRLAMTGGITIPAVRRVSDVALAGSRMYVLDQGEARVLVIDTASGATAEFGRRGGGPGEFQNPMSLALSPNGDTIAVADGRGVDYFDSAGEFIRNVDMAFPCNPQEVHLAWISSGIHVSTSCVTAGADTVHAYLWKLGDDGSLEEVARTARYSMDGTFGSLYGARMAVAESGDGLLFGAGTLSCVRAVTGQGAAESRCGLDDEVFRAPKPVIVDPDRGGVMAALLTWPDPLPAYMDRLASGNDVYLLRVFSGDSVVLRRIHGGAATDVLVAPADELIRCRGDRCYWAVHETASSRIVAFPLPAGPES